MKRKIKQIILGGISPFIGLLIFFIQLQINPHGRIKYIIVQSMFTMIFLMYFFLCAYFCSKEITGKNGLWFFVVLIAFCIINILFERIQESFFIAIIVSGIAAPFHYVTPYLHFQADKHYVIPSVFPVVVCMVAFKMGEQVNRLLRESK